MNHVDCKSPNIAIHFFPFFLEAGNIILSDSVDPGSDYTIFAV